MALATQCPHCHTTFRVAADQLKLRGGIVRCGACQSIFDGNAHLVDLDARPALPAAAGAPAPAPEASQDPASEPVYTLDFTHTFDPFGILPGAQPVPEAGVEPEPGPDSGTLPAAAPLNSHPVAPPAAAAPFAAGGPQVWRSAKRPGSEQDAASNAASDTEAHAEPARPDAAAAAVADPGAVLAAAAGVPAETAEPAPSEATQPSYAPSGRIEPRLEPLPDADRDDKAEPDHPSEPAAGVSDDVPAPGPDAPAPSFVPRERIVPQPATATVPGAAPETQVHAEAAPFPADRQRLEPGFGLPVDEEIVAQALPDDDHHETDAQPAAMALAPAPAAASDNEAAAAALPLRASAAGDAAPAAVQAPTAAAAAAAAKSARTRSLDARTRRSSLKPTKIEPPKLRLQQEDADEPEFVRRSRRQERTVRTRRILMGIGAALLLLVLAAQLVLTFRNGMAARNPLLKPGLETACAALGCRVELPTQAGNLAIETGELATLGPDTYSLNTLLRNQGTLVQAWPSIELELNDADNKPVLRRVFGPAEYLPPGVSAASGFGPRSEQAIRLHFALSELKPSDYHLFVFYP